MRAIRIRTKPDRTGDKIEFGGFLDGKQTYLWFGLQGECIGTLSDQKLYRLAKAIVRHVEEADHE